MDLPPPSERASTMNADLAVPAPEPSPAHYTRARIQRGIDYAKARLSLNPTPTIEKLLIIYRAACAAALHDILLADPQSDTSPTKNLDEIREYEIAMTSKAWFFDIHTPAQVQLEKQLLQLRRLTIWSRWGEYAMALTRSLSTRSPEAGTGFWRRGQREMMSMNNNNCSLSLQQIDISAPPRRSLRMETARGSQH